MPSTCCAVVGCHNRGGHQFPADINKKKAWVIAIKRAQSKQGDQLWTPGPAAVVCSRHFKASDYKTQTKTGAPLQQKKLLETAVPSIFWWREGASKKAEERQNRLAERKSKSQLILSSLETQIEAAQEEQHKVFSMEDTDVARLEEVITVSQPELKYKDQGCVTEPQPTFTAATQTADPTLDSNRWSLDNLIGDSEGIQNYTGLSSYNVVIDVFASLGPGVHCLDYIHGKKPSLPIKDQFFLTLIKLRKYWSNFDLSRMFKICESEVYNIFVTWIRFISLQWKEISIWPARDRVHFYAPTDFKTKFPSTRVIVDGAEIPIKKPGGPAAQQATFSSYKNRNTAKVLVGVTPGGLVSFVSSAYGGPTSDRQIVERENLAQKCDPRDSVMADKGFDVQDLFAPYDVKVNIPAFFKKQNKISGSTILKDRKIASKRAHVERIIGLGKTYKILCNPLNHTESLLASDIIFICYMLVNFRPCIVPRNA